MSESILRYLARIFLFAVLVGLLVTMLYASKAISVNDSALYLALYGERILQPYTSWPYVEKLVDPTPHVGPIDDGRALRVQISQNGNVVETAYVHEETFMRYIPTVSVRESPYRNQQITRIIMYKGDLATFTM